MLHNGQSKRTDNNSSYRTDFIQSFLSIVKLILQYSNTWNIVKDNIQFLLFIMDILL